MRSVLAAILGFVFTVVAAAAAPPLNENAIASVRFGNDAAWYENNIPFFESSDPLLDWIYYYRWQVFRAHQRDLGQRGYISTEFLSDVGWQLEPYASLNDATGFHIYEGRWLRNRRYTNDYIDFMADAGNDRHFAEAIGDAVHARLLVDGDLTFAASHLEALKRTYAEWDDHYDKNKRLYWIMPLLDATEYTISSIDASGGKDGFWGGEAFRPSINSYMFANAQAISRLADLTGDRATASAYSAKAEQLRTEVLRSLWNPASSHFIDRYFVSNQFVKYWEPIRGRELVGYLPWTFGLVPEEAQYAESWRYLLSADGLAGPKGLRTVGPSYEYYMRQYRYDGPTGLRECQWNGPVWPFQTTQVLLGMQNLLNGQTQSVVSRGDYMRLLRQYAGLHLQDNVADLEEDYDPATGKPIVGLPRSHHYFHSGFNDLVITGVVGIRPRSDNVLEINPLARPHDPNGLRYFALQSAPYHGHLVDVVFDFDGRHYGIGSGIFVFVDGKLAASSPKITKLTADLTPKAPFPVERPIDLAFNLKKTGYPHPNASINADVLSLYPAVDGRVWFFPEAVNGWSTDGGAGQQWYAVDFGKETAVKSAELAFFADGAQFAAPSSYRLQAFKGKKWIEVARSDQPMANGIIRHAWREIAARQVRVVMLIPKGKVVRLVEMKLF